MTLSQYIRCNYNKNETARELNLHRQSLIYRLKKLKN
ncbi:MAG: helix-turn-helix domain-containing protein [Clostridium sp.]